MDEPKTLDLLKLLAPFLAGTAVAAVLAVVLLMRFTPLGAVGAGGSLQAVTFDIVKFSNAQRAVASAFIKKGSDIAEANDLLLGLSERTREAIASVAGPNTVVLVKQSVAQGVERDITDEVLKKLKLPVNVPTNDAVAYTLDVAPTMLAAPSPQRLPRNADLPAGRSALP